MEYIEALRDKLHEKIAEKETTKDKEVIEISQELDKLICIYYKAINNN